MIIMRPAQQGHGFGSTRACSGSAVQSVSCGGTKIAGRRSGRSRSVKISKPKSTSYRGTLICRFTRELNAA
jgi:hypothetical protein